MKKLIALIVIIAGVLGVATFTFAPEGLDIKIKNKTNEEISGLQLTFAHNDRGIEIPSITPGEKYKLNVNPNDDFSESALVLQYVDNLGELHTEYVIGYFEKGYSGRCTITIKSVDQNGQLSLEIDKRGVLI